jgi:hypothetical protein
LSRAQTEELTTRNVAALVRLPKLRRTRRKAWTSDDARRLLEHARTARDPLYAAYVLILVLGLRKGEVLGLPGPTLTLTVGSCDIAAYRRLDTAAYRCQGQVGLLEA